MKDILPHESSASMEMKVLPRISGRRTVPCGPRADVVRTSLVWCDGLLLHTTVKRSETIGLRSEFKA